MGKANKFGRLSAASEVSMPSSKHPPLILVRQTSRIAGRETTATANFADDLLQAVVTGCASNVAVLDQSGTILYRSKAWTAFERANSLAGSRNCFDQFKQVVNSPDEMSTSLSDDMERILSGEQKEFHTTYSYRGLAQAGQFVIHAARLNLPKSVFRVLITYERVMPQKEALRKSDDRLTRLLETTKSLVWEASEDWRFTYVSEQARRMLGYPVAEWYEPNFLTAHIHPDDRQRVLAVGLNQSAVTEDTDLTFRMVAKDGRVVWLRNLISVENGKPRNMRGFMINVTETKRAEEALFDLGGKLITAQEEERRRVARELHDDLNQRMALLCIELEQLEQDLRQKQLRVRCEMLLNHAQEISSDIHRLSYKLHPTKLDHLGLVPAVKSLCEELSRNQKLKIQFRHEGFPATLAADVTLCIFRIAQEALRNCLKHSGAQAVQVVLAKTSSSVRLSISDNGSGFDTNSDLMKRGLGFISMRERTRLVGGEMQIYSQRERGTRIVACVPLSRAPGDMPATVGKKSSTPRSLM
jgi:PAS domain S-box-containing protein